MLRVTPDHQTRSGRPLWFAVARWVVVIFAVSYMVTYLTQNMAAFSTYRGQLRYSYLAASVPIAVASFLLLPLAAKVILQGLGQRLTLSKAIWIYYMAQPTKYLPGGLWLVPGRLMLYRISRVPATIGATGILLENVLAMVAAIAVGFAGRWISAPTVAAGVTTLACCLAVVPSWISGPLGQWFRSTRAAFKGLHLWAVTRSMILSALLYICFWVGLGVAIAGMAQGLSDLPWSLAPKLLSCIAFAWLAGMLSFVVPAGIGAREGVMVLLLSEVVDAPLPFLIAVGARVLWIVGDVSGLALAMLLEKNHPDWSTRI